MSRVERAFRNNLRILNTSILNACEPIHNLLKYKE